jgi:hypothetical protein
MSDGEMTLIHVEQDEPAARIVVGFLESNGIAAKISEDDLGDQIPALEAVGGVKIFVPADKAELARELLATRDEG